MHWMNDEDYLRGQVPMTKSEVRILTMAEFDLSPGMEFLDIGSGTGSIAVAAASLGCRVTASECNEEALDLIAFNGERFDVELKILPGKAPDSLEEKMYDRIFIGGNRGNLKEILDYSHRHLNEEGILGGNFVTIQNVETMRRFLKEKGYEMAVKHIAVSREDKIGILRAENGVFLVKGRKR